MRHRVGVVLLAMAAVLASGGQAGAAFDEWMLGFKTGTLGLGGELRTNLMPDVHLRGSVQWFKLGFDLEIDDIDYDVDLRLLNPMLALDWYPWGWDFRLSGGVIFNGSNVDVEATSDRPVEIGNRIYLPSDFGSLRGKAQFNDLAPYLGIGFGNPFLGDGRWGFMSELGVAFIGSPKVRLRATGPLADNPLLQEDLAREERELEDKLRRWRFYPVLSLTLYYRF
jgi:hypothetical protein